MSKAALKILNQEVITCTLCPRLVNYREIAPQRPPFENEIYWRRPVPGFGDPKAWLFIVGLAPSPQGGNRTGRIFTGDKTGQFLMKALYQQGFANQSITESRDDGLELKGCYLTAAVKCVPPEHKPTTQEFFNCSRYLHRELEILTNIRCVLALGKWAFEAYMKYAKSKGKIEKFPKFKHGCVYQLKDLPSVYASYHPSPQNTNTGKMTEKMFNELLAKIKKDHSE
jgi:uracil-DNA glycosylase family 4